MVEERPRFFWDGTYLRDHHGAQIGRIEEGYVRDPYGHRVGEIDGVYVRDALGRRIAELDGEFIRDGIGARIALLEEAEEQIAGAGGITLVGLWVVFARSDRSLGPASVYLDSLRK